MTGTAKNDLQARLAELQEQYTEISIKYQNMKDRQSFRILGFTTGIALSLIGIILGQTWLLRISLIACAALIIIGAAYGIKKADRAELEQQEVLVQTKQDQINSLKKAIKLQKSGAKKE